jgi:GDP-4-dehydro-6-deoxy-D-mannose reductase
LRTLVTGVAGFVGRHLLAAMSQEGGAELHGADRTPAEQARSDAALGSRLASYRALDVTDAPCVAAWVRELKPERIVHLAAQSSGADSIEHPAETYRANALGGLHVLEAARAHAPGAVVLLVGSADVYGSGAAGARLTEDAPLCPRNAYALSKAAQDALGELYAQGYSLPVVRTRTFSHTGPGQRPRFALAGFADQLARIDARAHPPELKVGNLEGIRDYGDVRDVVRAYLLLLARGSAGEAYNVCTGTGHRMRDLVDRLLQVSGVSARVITDAARLRPRDSEHLVGDPGRVHARTGWTAEIPIEKTLTDLYRDARERVRREVGS